MTLKRIRARLMNNNNVAINAAPNEAAPRPHLQRFQTCDIDECCNLHSFR
ncbi:AraC family transcriptional regulator [Pseudomonas syringae pv. philadelphi]|uniref:AraC family transcriptional regulator n=1 Tax=Pseudomonas syringae pv. philadelphi TaxID=251706 RepID=A0A3M3YY40_9PSED|nr:AraC family transcriptional regulator [Pseudomonas syringae pv. philadelphi]